MHGGSGSRAGSPRPRLTWAMVGRARAHGGGARAHGGGGGVMVTDALRRAVDHEAIERLEQRAERLVALSLWLLAGYITVDAGLALWNQERPQASPAGIAITTLSIGVMWWLARAKRPADPPGAVLHRGAAGGRRVGGGAGRLCQRQHPHAQPSFQDRHRPDASRLPSEDSHRGGQAAARNQHRPRRPPQNPGRLRRPDGVSTRLHPGHRSESSTIPTQVRPATTPSLAAVLATPRRSPATPRGTAWSRRTGGVAERPRRCYLIRLGARPVGVSR
jgi:hypothetical protein